MNDQEQLLTNICLWLDAGRRCNNHGIFIRLCCSGAWVAILLKHGRDIFKSSQGYSDLYANKAIAWFDYYDFINQWIFKNLL